MKMKNLNTEEILAILTIRMKNEFKKEKEDIRNKDDTHYEYEDHLSDDSYLAGYERALYQLETLIKIIKEEEEEKKEIKEKLNEGNIKIFNAVIK